MRQVGIICGPFFIFWTKTWDFNLFGTEINSYNSASLLESYTYYESDYYLPLKRTGTISFFVQALFSWLFVAFKRVV